MTVETGRDLASGRRQRRTVKAPTKAEALRKAAEAKVEMEAGLVSGAGSTTGDFLQHWLDAVVPRRVGAATVANYRTVIDRHVTPALGRVELRRLTPEMVDKLLMAKASAGLSRSYVGRIRSVLADALTEAEARGYVHRNAARIVRVPKCKTQTPRRSLTAVEARAIMVAAKEDRLEALIVTGLTLGLRPGELSGLLWSDVDLIAKPPVLSVSGSMKRVPKPNGSGYRLERGPVKRSTAGERTLAVPALLAKALIEHRRRQAAERLRLGDLWQDSGLVFCSVPGGPLDPSVVRAAFARVAKAAGVAEGDGASFPYAMRHTATSLFMDAGATVYEVADMLGDDPATLLRHYRHRVGPVVLTAAARTNAIYGEKAEGTDG
ncbi:MAG: tyrosine-type recombinase/integrase [Actinomycetota bacterium]|nr:tyrosine-type recombinase/integrase [Actinomycetota bacterium]